MSDQSFPVKIVIEAVDELTKPLKAVNAQIEKFSSPIKKVTSEFAHLSHASGLSHLTKEMGEVREKAGEVGKEALELGTKLVTMEALGVGATFELAKSMAEAGHEIGETSKLLGVHVEWLQEMQYAGAKVGVSNETLNQGLARFSKNVGDAAAGTGEALIAFRALGVPIRDATGHVRAMESILPDVAEKLSHVKNASVQNALAFRLFGREGGANMLRLMRDGSKGLDEARQKAKALGFELGEDGVKNSEQFMESYTDVQYTLIGLRNTIGSALIPGLKDAMGEFVKFMGSHREEIKKFAEDFAKNIPQMVQAVENTAEGIFKAIKGVITVFEGVSSVIGPTNTAMLAFAFTVGAPLIRSVVSLTGSLMTLIPTLVTTGIRLGAMAFGPVVAAAGNFFTAIQAGYPIMEAFNLVLAANPIGLIIVGVTALGVAAYELVKHWEGVKTFFSGLWSMITAGIDAVKEKLGFLTYLIPGFGQIAAARDIYHHFEGAQASLGPAVGAQQTVASIANQQNSIAQAPAEASVKVSFENMPRGAKVSQDNTKPSPVDLSLGYAMVHP